MQPLAHFALPFTLPTPYPAHTLNAYPFLQCDFLLFHLFAQSLCHGKLNEHQQIVEHNRSVLWKEEGEGGGEMPY